MSAPVQIVHLLAAVASVGHHLVLRGYYPGSQQNGRTWDRHWSPDRTPQNVRYSKQKLNLMTLSQGYLHTKNIRFHIRYILLSYSIRVFMYDLNMFKSYYFCIYSILQRLCIFFGVVGTSDYEEFNYNKTKSNEPTYLRYFKLHPDKSQH